MTARVRPTAKTSRAARHATVESLECRALLSVASSYEPPASAAMTDTGTILIGTGGTAAPPARVSVDVKGKPAVRHGTSYTFKAVFHFDETTARQPIAAIDVHGPDGFVGRAEPLRLKVARDGMRATATYRVAAPGGRFDAADNGDYAIVWSDSVIPQVNPSPTGPAIRFRDGYQRPLGTFSVAAREPRPAATNLTHRPVSGGMRINSGGVIDPELAARLAGSGNGGAWNGTPGISVLITEAPDGTRRLGYVMTGPTSATIATGHGGV